MTKGFRFEGKKLTLAERMLPALFVVMTTAILLGVFWAVVLFPWGAYETVRRLLSDSAALRMLEIGGALIGALAIIGIAVISFSFLRDVRERRRRMAFKPMAKCVKPISASVSSLDLAGHTMALGQLLMVPLHRLTPGIYTVLGVEPATNAERSAIEKMLGRQLDVGQELMKVTLRSEELRLSITVPVTAQLAGLWQMKKHARLAFTNEDGAQSFVRA